MLLQVCAVNLDFQHSNSKRLLSNDAAMGLTAGVSDRRNVVERLYRSLGGHLKLPSLVCVVFLDGEVRQAPHKSTSDKGTRL